MTKATIAVPETTPAAIATQPAVIRITEFSNVAFAVAGAFCRIGYVFDENQLPETHGAVGRTTIVLIRGTPSAHAVKLAEEAEAHATAMEAMAYTKAVEAAARAMVEQAARDEKQKLRDAEIAAARKALRTLEALPV